MNSMKRNEKMIRAMADNTPEWLKGAKPYLQKAAPILAFLAMLIDTAAPYVIHGSIWAYKKFKELPDELEWAVFGVWLCFFGGVYPVLVLTVETFLMTGWDQTSAAILELYNQFLIVQEASKKDDERDDDGDGIRDVDQRSGKENFTHKMDLFLKTADPKKIQSAAGVVFNAWFAVVAVLRVEFAKTTALGVAIGDATFKTIGRVIVPICDVCMPEKYAKWVPMVAKYMARAFGMYLAWTLQAVISAFHSGIRGGPGPIFIRFLPFFFLLDPLLSFLYISIYFRFQPSSIITSNHPKSFPNHPKSPQKHVNSSPNLIHKIIPPPSPLSPHHPRFHGGTHGLGLQGKARWQEVQRRRHLP